MKHLIKPSISEIIRRSFHSHGSFHSHQSSFHSHRDNGHALPFTLTIFFCLSRHQPFTLTAPVDNHTDMHMTQSLPGGTEPLGAGTNGVTACAWIELRTFEALSRKLSKLVRLKRKDRRASGAGEKRNVRKRSSFFVLEQHTLELGPKPPSRPEHH